MGIKQIRASEDFYAKVKSENREGETLERLIDDYTLIDFDDDMADLRNDHPDIEELEVAIEASDERAKNEL